MKNILFRLSVILFLLVFVNSTIAQLSGYSFRRMITIHNEKVFGSSNLTNFPILISHTDVEMKTIGNGGYVTNASGYDIGFGYSDTATTALDHQIEKYDSVTGEYVAWVRIPSLPYNADLEIYIYYGNSSITTDPSTTNTWNSDYAGIWHLHNDFLDGTSDNNDGTNSGSTDISGKIGDGQDFDGVNAYIDIPNSATLENVQENDYTVSAWFKPETTPPGTPHSDENDARYALFTKQGYHTGPYYMTSYFVADHWLTGDVFGGTYGDPGHSIGTYHYVVQVVNKTLGTTDIYVNGNLETTASWTAGTAAREIGTATWKIGIASPGAGTYRWAADGVIDEVRLSSIARSTDWILTEYNSQGDPATFYTLGVALPITLLSFEAAVNSKSSVKIEWSTATEFDNDYFTLERSSGGSDFEEIAIIEGAGMSYNTENYSHVDKDPYQITYYRLKQTDFDEKFTYSKIISVRSGYAEQAVSMTVYPNPADPGSEINVFIEGVEEKEIHLVLLDHLGRELYSKVILNKSEWVYTTIEPEKRLRAGLYIVKLSNSDSGHEIYHQKLIIE